MHIKTILNRVQKFKSFVYGRVCWVENALVPTVDVELQPRRNSRPVCSGCRRERPGYDRQPTHSTEFIPLWGIKVFFLYAPCRVACPDCGIRVEWMPWVSGKHRLSELLKHISSAIGFRFVHERNERCGGDESIYLLGHVERLQPV
jgi:hypothetical protein